jgi:potassium efflux system protein
MVANFVSGILILFERPIRVGDTVTVGQHTGTVSKISIRSTTVTDSDRKEHIIPNSLFINDQVTNWTLKDSISRLVLTVHAARGSDPRLVYQVLHDAVLDNARVLQEPPPAVFFVGSNERGLEFEVRVFTRSLLDRMPLTHELHLAIEDAFELAGIEPAAPQPLAVGVRSPLTPAAAPARAEPHRKGQPGNVALAGDASDSLDLGFNT